MDIVQKNFLNIKVLTQTKKLPEKDVFCSYEILRNNFVYCSEIELLDYF